MLAELAAANAAFAVIKQAVSNGKEIAAAGNAIAEFVGAKEKLQAKHRGAGHRIPDEQCLKRKSAALQVTLVVLNHKDRISDFTATGLVGQAVLRDLFSDDPAEGHPTHDWGLESLCHLEGSRGLQLFFKILKRSRDSFGETFSAFVTGLTVVIE